MEEKLGAKKRLAHFSSLIVFISLIAFTLRGQDTPLLWPAYNDSIEINRSLENENPRMHFKLLTSRVTDRNEVFKPLLEEVKKLSEQEYQRLKPLILEQDIISLQKHINEGSLTYENLVLFYLYRIYHYELDPQKTLYTIIALNENVVEQAKALDSTKSNNFNGINHPIYGMPILLKDNIGTQDMYTTAGAVALQRNKTEDAFIVKQLRNKGALILGKVNLSEWAYYMCRGCPVGYSAIGGQTLNPYGRGIFESGGSSSGSGAAVAANYAVAAVGTETSGSILSPSSQNSVVGLKPTIGLLSRTGIVPISSTLDTPGPMTRNVVDNAILLSAMTGKDKADKKSTGTNEDYLNAVLNAGTLKGKRLGVFKDLLETDSIY
ncbi:amidase family protein, partial [Eudoraea sp.]|uniref:amidase family protein n=1 Tax=Eudoraea sp. TaxID=1979955 RepID=UPI003C727811